VLEDDLERAHVVGASAQEMRRERPALELHRPGRRRDEPEQCAGKRCLAASRLADEPECLTGPDRRRDGLERVHRVAALAKGLPELVEPDEWLPLPIDDRERE